MSWAIITLTKGGLYKAKEIKRQISPADIYTLPKWKEENTEAIEGSFGDFVGDIFHKYDILLFIMATGIVVRAIARYIDNKTVDPAILVMDEKGKHVISLLSGHIGGGNEAALYLSEKIGATAVITTASDVNDSIAVDTLAVKLGCYIDSMEEAKEITAKIVNKERVGILSDVRVDISLPSNIIRFTEYHNSLDFDGVIYITSKTNIDLSHPYVQLIPKRIVVGIGCKKGISGDRIVNAIKLALDRYKLHHRSIKTIATIDIKQKEKGIIEAADFFDVALTIIEKNEIKKIENKFQQSKFVMNAIEVGAVCEPCGYLASSRGKCIMKKTSFDGITLSLWEEA
ncbi:cobalt-precorrin 5A hydrolase [Alkaliphilus pronyensis]|uniref:Cobalt-precorrin 5A hydrolase n=1 Tax=Alkaliphilus pronyensis TaxID=1482732 RepID=A0A6I0FIW7_9FIRM|nr:cobalt-precorrin 5A hydrolase [Alkaliphilus pronyensis]KAB3539057.1 cobalt-precorrin 5A hydrolase [Alkaliphilus pronyensis]